MGANQNARKHKSKSNKTKPYDIISNTQYTVRINMYRNTSVFVYRVGHPFRHMGVLMIIFLTVSLSRNFEFAGTGMVLL